MIEDTAATVVLLVGFLSLFGWTLVAGRLAHGQPILEFESRQRVPWHWPVLLVSFFLLFFGPLMVREIFSGVAGDDPAPRPAVLSYWALIVSSFVALALIVLLIKFHTKATWRDLGWQLKKAGYDVALGVVAFLLVGPLVFMLQFIFVTLFEWKSEHPLLETLKEDATGGTFAAVAILAVVVAPVSEEFFFRVLLQGWLERLFFGRVQRRPAGNGPEASTEEPILAALVHEPAEDWHAAYTSPSPDQAAANLAEGSPPRAKSFLPPILCSSVIFAALHSNHGPDPIPLFVLAVALGYLYQRTHRLLPSATLHFCLNGTTMLLVWLQMQGGGE